MDLCIELLGHMLSTQKLHLCFPEQTEPFSELIDSQSYQALCAIRNILKDEALSDPECFLKIEEIICTLEKLEISCGTRHDFG